MNIDFEYIIIDDNDVDIFIATKMIEAYNEKAIIHSYLYAKEAIDAIINKGAEQNPTILLVDINMPIMDGFQFMELFEKLPEEVTNKYVSCFLTSSINETDISLAKTFKTIKMYINKPLMFSVIEEIIETTKS